MRSSNSLFKHFFRPIDMNHKGEKRRTSLIYTSMYAHVDVVGEGLEQGMMLNEQLETFRKQNIILIVKSYGFHMYV